MKTQTKEYTTTTPPVITPSEIYNIASLASKTKRAEAFDLVKKMVDSEPLDEYQIAKLYNFFLPPVPAKCKTPEQWVAKAMAKKDVRNFLNWLYSDGTRLVASDGHRLHVWNTDKYPAGYYDAALNPVEVDAKYVDIDRVIPKSFAEKDTYTLALKDLETVDAGNNGLAYKIPGWKPSGLNAVYLRDAINRGKGFKVLGRNDSRGSTLIQGPFENCFSVVMGMRLA